MTDWRRLVGCTPEQLLRRTTGLADDAPQAALVQAARWPSKFLPTLVSYWQMEGRPVSPALAYEAEAELGRQERYAKLLTRLCHDHGATAFKGPALLRLYPPGLLRKTSDLDLFMRDEAELWAAARALVDDGWGFYVLGVSFWRGDRTMTLALCRDAPDQAVQYPDRVELTTGALDGDFFWSPPRPDGAQATDSTVGALVHLLAEQFDRKYGPRDLLDAALIAHALSHDDRWAAAVEAVASSGLVRQWRHLVAQVEQVLPGRVPPAAVAALEGARPPRRWPALANLSPSPAGVTARACAHALRQQSLRRVHGLASRLLAGLQQRLGAQGLIDRDVPLFGFVLDERRHDEVRLDHAGPLARLATPVGTFGLVAGDEVPPEWVEAARWP